MTAPTALTAPCEWPCDDTCLPETDESVPDETRQAAKDIAVAVLWALSGHQFGACPYRVRPCPNNCGPGWGVGGQRPYYTQPGIGFDLGVPIVAWDGSHWINVACGCLGSTCRRTGPGMVHLPGPVYRVEQVQVADTILGDDEYSVEDDVLYRKGASWPAQDLSRPLPEMGTWSVTYLKGYPPPYGAAKMVGVLAAEFLAACTGRKCRLPRNVTSVSRNGVSFETGLVGRGMATIYDMGKTGITEIDLWLSAVNPHHIMQAPTVR